MSIRITLVAALALLWVVVFAIAYQPLKQTLVTAGLSLTAAVAMLITAFLASLFLFVRWMWRQNQRSSR